MLGNEIGSLSTSQVARARVLNRAKDCILDLLEMRYAAIVHEYQPARTKHPHDEKWMDAAMLCINVPSELERMAVALRNQRTRRRYRG